MIEIRQLCDEDAAGVLTIAENLPEWFNETARHTSIPVDTRYKKGFVATDRGTLVGFISRHGGALPDVVGR